MTISKWIIIVLFSHQTFGQQPFWAWIDPKISPQENFFLFANQQWLEKHPVPPAEAEWSVFNELKHHIDLELAKTIQHPPKPAQQKIFKQLHQLYLSGMDLDTIEVAGLKPLNPILQQIHPTLSSLAILHHYNIPAFFSLYPYSSLHHPKRIIAGVNQPNLILPDRSYYLDDNPRNQKIIKAYQQYLKQLFHRFGYSTSQVEHAVNAVLKIETSLAGFSADRDFFRQPKNIDHVLSLSQFKQNYPNLHVKDYFAKLHLHPQTINVSNPKYFAQLNDYLPSLTPSEIQDYFIANLLVETAEFLPKAYAEPACQFNKMLRGNQACPPREEQILAFMNQYLGFALGELYVALHPGEKTIAYVTEIYHDIRQSLKQVIEQSQWLSPTTKRKALLKLNKMQSRIGYPPPLDYRHLTMDSNIYLENVLSARQFETAREWNKIDKKINPQEWDMPPQSINAYYSVAQNQINIPLGIMQAPFFSLKATGAANYGGIGVVIGHEMFHGFDDEGSQFDENGKLAAWWTTREWQFYQSQVQCIQKLFSTFKIPSTHLKVNGELVSGEAIADLGGLSLSLDAYRHSKHFHQDQNSHGYSPLQQFFISFAQLWASNIKPEEAYRKGLIDPHPPKLFRVNGSLRNNLDFYQAFHLQEPDKVCKFF